MSNPFPKNSLTKEYNEGNNCIFYLRLATLKCYPRKQNCDNNFFHLVIYIHNIRM